MRVDVWSDIVCPWCYIGKRHLEEAIERVGGEVTVHYRSFELDPGAAHSDPAVSSSDRLASKYGVTKEQANAMQARVEEAARRAGLDYHLDQTHPGNSRDAHRLIHLADRHGLQGEMKERLMRAYFVEGLAIDDPSELGRLGVEIGLDQPEVEDLLAGTALNDEVDADEQMASALGITGVPFFVFDDRIGVSGAQPVDVLVQALTVAADPSAEATPTR